MKVSKMMEEVWRWKEEVAEETKDMTSEELIAHFRQAGQRLAEKTGKELNVRKASRRRP